jgi:type I restriction enzyme R subunit
LPPAIEHILAEGHTDDGAAVKRYRDVIPAILKALYLADGSPQATEHAVELHSFLWLEWASRSLI